jgi:hypothetical protein
VRLGSLRWLREAAGLVKPGADLSTRWSEEDETMLAGPDAEFAARWSEQGATVLGLAPIASWSPCSR